MVQAVTTSNVGAHPAALAFIPKTLHMLLLSLLKICIPLLIAMFTSSAMVHEVKGKCGWSHQLPDSFEQINVHTEVRCRKVSCKKVARGS